MNARLIAFAVTLVAGATVSSAQTVPAEAWVGPPIPTVGGATSRADVVAELKSFLAQPRATQEAWAGTLASAGVHTGDATRAEVLADTSMATRAGLTDYATREEYDPASAVAKRRNARYMSLRFGPAYTAEVARLRGSNRSVAMTSQGSDAIGE
ncbi:MAG: hypothetical protein ABWZ88_22025 [Variovorax sp.]